MKIYFVLICKGEYMSMHFVLMYVYTYISLDGIENTTKSISRIPLCRFKYDGIPFCGTFRCRNVYTLMTLRRQGVVACIFNATTFQNRDEQRKVKYANGTGIYAYIKYASNLYIIAMLQFLFRTGCRRNLNVEINPPPV